MLGEDAWGAVGVLVPLRDVQLELRSGLWTGNSSSTASLANHVFLELALNTWTLSCWNRFEAYQFQGRETLIPQRW